jgi:hypothetical protein
VLYYGAFACRACHASLRTRLQPAHLSRAASDQLWPAFPVHDVQSVMLSRGTGCGAGAAARSNGGIIDRLRATRQGMVEAADSGNGTAIDLRKTSRIFHQTEDDYHKLKAIF